MQHCAPIVVEDFKCNSYAQAELGVEREWTLRRIGNRNVANNTNFAEVNRLLKDSQKDLPVWPLRISFYDQRTGKEHELEFGEKPIGIEFTNRSPITVKKIQ